MGYLVLIVLSVAAFYVSAWTDNSMVFAVVIGFVLIAGFVGSFRKIMKAEAEARAEAEAKIKARNVCQCLRGKCDEDHHDKSAGANG